MKEFKRPKIDRKLFGVCSGFGKYTDTDPFLWRVAFLALLFIPFPSLIFYLLLTIITPSE
jgi:phage shock protein PspC (stress-responsive transcriptional regulator)